MFKLPPHVSEKYNEARASEEARRAVFRSLSNEDLLLSAKFWQQHCLIPKRFGVGDTVYDATFWHLIVPELMARVEGNRETRLEKTLRGVIIALQVLQTMCNVAKLHMGRDKAAEMIDWIKEEIGDK